MQNICLKANELWVNDNLCSCKQWKVCNSYNCLLHAGSNLLISDLYFVYCYVLLMWAVIYLKFVNNLMVEIVLLKKRKSVTCSKTGRIKLWMLSYMVSCCSYRYNVMSSVNFKIQEIYSNKSWKRMTRINSTKTK